MTLSSTLAVFRTIRYCIHQQLFDPFTFATKLHAVIFILVLQGPGESDVYCQLLIQSFLVLFDSIHDATLFMKDTANVPSDTVIIS